MTDNYIKWPCDPIMGQKKGYYEAREGDAVVPERPYTLFKSVQKDIAFTQTATDSNSEVCVNDNDKLRIRYLTPRECFRLMGQTEEDIDKIQELGLSKSTQYKLAGNSIVVDVLEAIFKGIYIDDTFEKPKGKQMSLEGWV